MTIKEQIQLAIQTLGAPVTDYWPAHANVERQAIINRAYVILLWLLWKIEDGRNGEKE